MADHGQWRPICAVGVGRHHRLGLGQSCAGLQGLSRQLCLDRHATKSAGRFQGARRLASVNLAAPPRRSRSPTTPRRAPSSKKTSCRLQISRLGEDAGFVTGYYEPILDGSRTQTDVYNVPVYRRPSNLFVRGFKQDSRRACPTRARCFAKSAAASSCPYYDRGEIEDGAIAGPRPRNLLAERSDRSAVCANPGIGAGSSSGRLDHPHQLRCP